MSRDHEGDVILLFTVAELLGGCNDCHTSGSFLGKRDGSRTLAGFDVGFAISRFAFQAFRVRRHVRTELDLCTPGRAYQQKRDLRHGDTAHQMRYIGLIAAV